MFVQQFAVGALIGLSVPDVTVTCINATGAPTGVGQHFTFGFTGSITSYKTGLSTSCWAQAVKPTAAGTFPAIFDGLHAWSCIAKNPIGGSDKYLTPIAIGGEFIGLIQGVCTASVRGLTASTAFAQYSVLWPVAAQHYLATDVAGGTGGRPAAGVPYKALMLDTGWTSPGVVATEGKTILFSGIDPFGYEVIS